MEMNVSYEFEISEEISVDKIAEILNKLNNASDEIVISIRLTSNKGGSVDAARQLIEAIKNTQAQVSIYASRYVVSAAAFIYLWFQFYKEPHVEIKQPIKPALLVYHRPRIMLSEPDSYIAFVADLPESNDTLESLREMTQIFDDLFNKLLEGCGYLTTDLYLTSDDSTYKHILQHWHEAYYSNQDVVIPLGG